MGREEELYPEDEETRRFEWSPEVAQNIREWQSQSSSEVAQSSSGARRDPSYLEDIDLRNSSQISSTKTIHDPDGFMIRLSDAEHFQGGPGDHPVVSEEIIRCSAFPEDVEGGKTSYKE